MEHENIPGTNSKELIRLSITGKNQEQWERLSQSLFNIIDSITKKYSSSSSDQADCQDSTAQVAQDIASIMSEWAKAKIERPSLENDNIKAEVALKFAQAKKQLAETRKIEEEIVGQRIDNKNKELNFLLENFERIISVMRVINSVNIEFASSGKEANLLVGPKPDELKVLETETTEETIRE